ncbi:MAG TPA: aminoglycoside phosphotransferase family protein [Candidatus Saccharimonadales bacterium]
MTEEKIKAYVRSLPPTVFGLGAYKMLRCTKLEGGLHHLNFKLTISDGAHTRKVVLRLPATSHNQHSLMDEAWYLAKLSPGIAPGVVYHTATSPLGAVLITKFMAGRHMPFDKFTKAHIITLAEQLARVHSIKNSQYSSGGAARPHTTGTYRNYALLTIREGNDKPYHRAKKIAHDDKTVSLARELLGQQLTSSDASWNQTEFSLCHGDLNIYNLLWAKNHLCLIDWDDARFGDPADDVAYIFAVNHASEAWRDTFLDAYLRVSGRNDILARINTYLLKNYLFDVVWSLGKLLEEQKGRSLIKLKQGAYRAMHEQRLEALKRYLSFVE